jgi:hypothetical protein
MAENKSPTKILAELVESLNKASGAAGQIIHQHQDPRFFVARKALMAAKDDILHMATFDITQSIAVSK